MRPLFVTVGTMCLTIILLAVGQRLVFSAWSNSVWDPSAPVQSMVFDELVLYTLFPGVVVVGTIIATTLTTTRPFAVSMLATLPVFLGVFVLKRFEIGPMILYLIGYAVLCWVLVKLTLRFVSTRRQPGALIPDRTDSTRL